MLNWLRELFYQFIYRVRLQQFWRRADIREEKRKREKDKFICNSMSWIQIIAVPKPNKPSDDANNYRPISLLCVPLKLFERLRLSRLFRNGRSTTDQVTLLTDDIEAGFEHNQTVGEALVDLTAAYDTVWLRGLHLKLLRMLPDRHMVSFVMELLTNRSSTLRTIDGQVSRF